MSVVTARRRTSGKDSRKQTATARRIPRKKLVHEVLSASARERFARTHDQLQLYARDINRLLQSERLKARELDAARKQLLQYARDLKKTYAAEKTRTEELHASYVETIRRLTYAAEYKDEETANHIQRISYYAKALAHELGWPSERQQLLFDAAPMHDVGKIGVPDTILLKEHPLTPEEWMVMKRHPAIGHDILSGSRSSLLAMAAEIAVGHHERWDGTGYPNGLKGETIPVSGRIVMLCDIYDALRSKRPYKPAFDHARCCDIMLNGDGRTRPGHFDPHLLETFARINGHFGAIYDELRDD